MIEQAVPLFVGTPTPIETDPAIVTELVAPIQASIAAAERGIGTKSGAAERTSDLLDHRFD